MREKLNVGAACTRSVVFATEEMPLKEAAGLMRKHHVGSLVVVRSSPAGKIVIGMLTDRDIAIVAVARDFDPQTLTVGQVMSNGAVTVTEHELLYGALEVMRASGVRRLPVVNAEGVLVGLIALDDVLEVLVEELGMFVQAMHTEARHEQNIRV